MNDMWRNMLQGVLGVCADECQGARKMKSQGSDS